MRTNSWILFVATLLLAGCVTTSTEIVRTPAGVAASRGQQHAPAASSAGEHVVVRGETLYAIAFRRGLDWRDLAAWNRLGAPYTIYPGQRLRLGSASASTSTNVAATTPRPAPSATTGDGTVETRPLTDVPPPAASPRIASTPSTSPTQTRPAVSPSTGATSQPPAATSQPSTSTSPTASPTTPTASTTAPAVPASTAPIAPAATNQAGGIRWRWPTQGEVVQRFTGSDLMRQGINIAGRNGQAVAAAADGEVVYSGSGLRGYGELIIIKHSGEFLSAYGHNRKRLVAEGQRVKAGEPIAEMGRTATDRDKLHFEIRRNGQPVDPMQFLPRH